MLVRLTVCFLMVSVLVVGLPGCGDTPPAKPKTEAPPAEKGKSGAPSERKLNPPQ